jgi:hypothetical protein
LNHISTHSRPFLLSCFFLFLPLIFFLFSCTFPLPSPFLSYFSYSPHLYIFLLLLFTHVLQHILPTLLSSPTIFLSSSSLFGFFLPIASCSPPNFQLLLNHLFFSYSPQPCLFCFSSSSVIFSWIFFLFYSSLSTFSFLYLLIVLSILSCFPYFHLLLLRHLLFNILYIFVFFPQSSSHSHSSYFVLFLFLLYF